nr:hypothetical protein GCM10020093_116660 [Planobispora longispora]
MPGVRRGPGCARCLALVDALVEEGWRAFLRREFGTAVPSGVDETVIAERESATADLPRAGGTVTAERESATAVPSEADETAIAEMVVDEPSRHDWRVVDAALDRLACPECGSRLGRGPVAARRATWPTDSATRRSRPTGRACRRATSTRSGSASP